VQEGIDGGAGSKFPFEELHIFGLINF